ncbi:hypothetical protein C0J45_23203 [Silurus meridionalis]|nr:hypothetical protein C0J45_23203 [Silurus meridionalis]
MANTHMFSGEIVTLRCDIWEAAGSLWIYSWYENNNKFTYQKNQEITIWVAGYADISDYSCSVHYGIFQISEISDVVTLIVQVVTPAPSCRREQHLDAGPPEALNELIPSSRQYSSECGYPEAAAGLEPHSMHFMKDQSLLVSHHGGTTQFKGGPEWYAGPTKIHLAAFLRGTNLSKLASDPPRAAGAVPCSHWNLCKGGGSLPSAAIAQAGIEGDIRRRKDLTQCTSCGRDNSVASCAKASDLGNNPSGLAPDLARAAGAMPCNLRNLRRGGGSPPSAEIARARMEENIHWREDAPQSTYRGRANNLAS